MCLVVKKLVKRLSTCFEHGFLHSYRQNVHNLEEHSRHIHPLTMHLICLLKYVKTITRLCKTPSSKCLTSLTTFLTQRAMELEGVAFCFANSLQFESKVYGDLWNCMETGTDANPRPDHATFGLINWPETLDFIEFQISG